MINCHNLNGGGGLQVADSICRQLNGYPYHHFIVVVSHHLAYTIDAIKSFPNVTIYEYEGETRRLFGLKFNKYSYLDDLVEKERIDVVLTVFGPSMWKPKVPHLCGFARGHFVFFDSPYYQLIGKFKTFIDKIKYNLLAYYFKQNSKHIYTENPYVTAKIKKLIRGVEVYTVTNYYHQVYDHIDLWAPLTLPKFEGVTLLTVTAMYPHKNLPIMVEIVKVLRARFPNFKFRFVLTIKFEQFPVSIDGIEDYFVFLGKVHVTNCPSLYQQADIMFMPTLMECFTATYPEAMRMGVPIVTTDLDFAHGLCGEAACYYSALDAVSAADAIYKVATDLDFANQLRQEGKMQLKKYDSYVQRVEKLFAICEQIANEKVI